MAKSIKGSGTRISGQGSSWVRRSTRWALRARDGLRCYYCGTGERAGATARERLHLDHVDGLDTAGTNARVVTCCAACNAAKRQLSRRAWAVYLAEVRGTTTRTVCRALKAQTSLPLDRALGRTLESIERTQGYAAAQSYLLATLAGS